MSAQKHFWKPELFRLNQLLSQLSLRLTLWSKSLAHSLLLHAPTCVHLMIVYSFKATAARQLSHVSWEGEATMRSSSRPLRHFLAYWCPAYEIDPDSSDNLQGGPSTHRCSRVSRPEKDFLVTERIRFPWRNLKGVVHVYRMKQIPFFSHLTTLHVNIPWVIH